MSSGFILIKKPYDNQVFYAEKAAVSLILDEGNYLVKIGNNRLPTLDSDYIPVQDGRLLGHEVSPGRGHEPHQCRAL